MTEPNDPRLEETVALVDELQRKVRQQEEEIRRMKSEKDVELPNRPKPITATIHEATTYVQDRVYCQFAMDPYLNAVEAALLQHVKALKVARESMRKAVDECVRNCTKAPCQCPICTIYFELSSALGDIEMLVPTQREESQ